MMIWYLKEAGLRMTALETQRKKRKDKGRRREPQRWLAAELLNKSGSDEDERGTERGDKAEASMSSDGQSGLLAYGDAAGAEPLSSI